MRRESIDDFSLSSHGAPNRHRRPSGSRSFAALAGGIAPGQRILPLKLAFERMKAPPIVQADDILATDRFFDRDGGFLHRCRARQAGVDLDEGRMRRRMEAKPCKAGQA